MSHTLSRRGLRARSATCGYPSVSSHHPVSGRILTASDGAAGADAQNLSPGVIPRFTAGWQEDYDRWQRRDSSARRYVYIWADGVYLQARVESAAECMLVIIGATPEGRKELLGSRPPISRRAIFWPARRDRTSRCWPASALVRVPNLPHAGRLRRR